MRGKVRNVVSLVLINVHYNVHIQRFNFMMFSGVTLL